MADATEVFSQWALSGKDVGMEKGHAGSVELMLNRVIPLLPENFKSLDLGCGNGWVVRLLAELGAVKSEGVDGAEQMIAKARSIDSTNPYHHGYLPEWMPESKVDLVHSMEFLYYLEDPASMLKTIREFWLEDNGYLIAGVDHYLEHAASLEWPEYVGVHMTTMSMDQWKEAMVAAGFQDIEIWQVAAKKDFPGTLVMLGKA